MNDTITKLAQQADVWCDQNCIDHPFYNVQWEQKFAELIVRECASLVENFTYLEEMGLDDYKEITGKEMILSTFGVEE